MRSDSFEGFILAGGRSSRMGRDKAFLKFGEKTFLENASDILKPVCSRVSVVLNRSQAHFIEKLSAGLTPLFDVFENRGAPGGIHTALKNCQKDWAVILACDLPFLTSGIIKKLAEPALHESRDFSAIVPVQPDGRRQPLCAVYRVRKCLPKIEEMLQKNDSVAVRDLLAALSIKTIPAADLSSNKLAFANINSQTDLDRLIDQP